MSKVLPEAYAWVNSIVVDVDDEHEHREFTKFMHVIDGWMYSTDGHRMYRAETDWADGHYYDGNKRPPWGGDSIPNLPKLFDKNYREDDLVQMVIGAPEFKFNEWRMFGPYAYINEVWFDYNYVISAALTGEEAWLSVKPIPSPMCGRNEYGQFLIMPVSL